MQPFEQLEDYCNKVSEQIRFKKARPMIVTELKSHLCDQRDTYMSSGDDEETATNKAIIQMGDAVLVGGELDNIHKPKPQWLMIILAGVLMLIGFCANTFIDNEFENLYSLNILAYVFAFGILICCYFLDFRIFGKYPKIIYGITVTLSAIAVVLAFVSGSSFNGRLLLNLGFSHVSLSYLSLIFPLVFALFVYGMRNKRFMGIILCGVAFLPLAIILILIPTVAGLTLYTVTSIIILCYAICKGWFGVNKNHGLLLVLIPSTVTGLLLLASNIDSLYRRLSLVINPYQDRKGNGYIQSLIRDIFSNCVFLGKGTLPVGIEEVELFSNLSSWLPLVYLTYQFGFIVLVCVVLLTVVFGGIGIYKALKEKSVLGSLIALTVIITFICQSSFYLLDSIGYGVVSVLSLPFISHGNSALLVNAALVGFMLSVFRTGEICQDNLVSTKISKSIFCYEDGRLIIDFNWHK